MDRFTRHRFCVSIRDSAENNPTISCEVIADGLSVSHNLYKFKLLLGWIFYKIALVCIMNRENHGDLQAIMRYRPILY